MAEYLIQDTSLINIADAIRRKTGKTDSLTPEQMVIEIDSLNVVYRDPAILYDAGDQYTETTGGWTNEGWTYYNNNIKPSYIYATHMQVTGGYSTPTGSGVSYESIVGTVNPVSVNGYSKIYANINITNQGSVYLGVSPTKNAAESSKIVTNMAYSKGEHTLEIDTSALSGDYYIVIFAIGSTNYGRTPSAQITKVWTE